MVETQGNMEVLSPIPLWENAEVSLADWVATKPWFTLWQSPSTATQNNCSEKEAQRGGPSFGREDLRVSLPKVIEYTTSWKGRDVGTWSTHSSPTASQALLRPQLQTGAVWDRLEKLGQGLMLQNLKLPCCPNSVTLFQMFLLMLKKWKMGNLSFKSQCCLYKNVQYHTIV